MKKAWSGVLFVIVAISTILLSIGCIDWEPKIEPSLTVSEYFSTGTVSFSVTVNDSANTSRSIYYSLYAEDGTVAASATTSIQTGSAQSISINDLDDGTYTLYLYLESTTSPNLSPASALPRTIYVDTTDPVVDAGSDISATESIQYLAATIDEQHIDTIAWTTTPTGAVFGSSSSATTSVVGASGTAATYTLTCTVTDLAGNTGSDNLTFNWDDTAPSVTIDTNDPVTWSDTAISLTATTSNVTTYQWSVESGSGSPVFGDDTAEDTTFTGPATTEDVYILRLTGTDALGRTDYDEITVQWDDENPTVDAGSNIASTNSVQTVSASITESNIDTIAWTSTPGSATFGNSAAAVTTVEGAAGIVQSYTLTCTVTDLAGNSATDTLTFNWDDDAPTAGIDNADPVTWTDTAVSLASTTGGATSYQWSVVSGVTGYSFTAATASSTDFSGAAGEEDEYVLRLEAFDDAGNSATDEITVQWDDASPVVDAGPDLSLPLNTVYSITAYIEEIGSGVASISWSPSDGTNINLTGTTGQTVNIEFTAADTITLDVTVTDTVGNTASDSVTVDGS